MLKLAGFWNFTSSRTEGKSQMLQWPFWNVFFFFIWKFQLNFFDEYVTASLIYFKGFSKLNIPIFRLMYVPIYNIFIKHQNHLQIISIQFSKEKRLISKRVNVCFLRCIQRSLFLNTSTFTIRNNICRNT